MTVDNFLSELSHLPREVEWAYYRRGGGGWLLTSAWGGPIATLATAHRTRPQPYTDEELAEAAEVLGLSPGDAERIWSATVGGPGADPDLADRLLTACGVDQYRRWAARRPAPRPTYIYELCRDERDDHDGVFTRYPSFDAAVKAALAIGAYWGDPGVVDDPYDMADDPYDDDNECQVWEVRYPDSETYHYPYIRRVPVGARYECTHCGVSFIDVRHRPADGDPYCQRCRDWGWDQPEEEGR